MTHALRKTDYMGNVAGINGIEITQPMKSDLDSRLSAQEAMVYPSISRELSDVSNNVPTNNQFWVLSGGVLVPTTKGPTQIDGSALYNIGDRENPISTGIAGEARFRFAGTIVGWTLLNDVSGSISISVQLGTFTQYPSLSAVLTASTTNAIKNQGSANVPFAMHDIIRYNVASTNSLVKQTLIELHVRRNENIGMR